MRPRLVVTGLVRHLTRCTAFVFLLLCGATHAQSLESVLSPGKLIQGHAKYEDDCRSCHVPFDRAAQDRLCMDCHKDIGGDVRAKEGFHGRMNPPTCRTCHTEHRGRDARIAEFDKTTFDHAQTDFALKGAHRKVECAKCHVSGKKWREAPQDCSACHRKDDVHKGSLGAKCFDCHTETNWKEAKFDHGRTRFALTGKHADIKCQDCHKDTRYKETPRQCIACHKDDDKHKGRFGEKCESCHGTGDWKRVLFNHDRDTKFMLRGKHGPPLKCESCHKGNLFKDRLGTACIDCHRNDDKHKGTLGNDCAGCHNERDWKEPARFDHQKTKFPLLGRHAKVECKACHKSAVFEEAPSACIACHRKDDKHAGNLGEQCADCHVERDWKTTTRFNHDKTQFRLRGAHAAPGLRCDSCHKDLKSFRNTPKDCFACHKKDDKHHGQLGEKCDTCHIDRDWKTTSFDHARTQFPLTGRHITVECRKCHETNRYKDARRECFACHRKDDKHKRAFGERCEKCHSTRDWKLWDFEHDKRSRYRLEGAHRRVACASCHTAPAPAGKDFAALGQACVGCHRGDDAHDGSFGTNCERCHVAENWKRIKTRLSGLGDSYESAGNVPLSRLSDSSDPELRMARVGVVLGDASHFARRLLRPREELR